MLGKAKGAGRVLHGGDAPAPVTEPIRNPEVSPAAGGQCVQKAAGEGNGRGCVWRGNCSHHLARQEHQDVA